MQKVLKRIKTQGRWNCDEGVLGFAANDSAPEIFLEGHSVQVVKH